MLESIWESFRDSIHSDRAKKELPILAKELHLKHRSTGGFGIYSGRWNNHDIRIEPNNYQTSIGIRINGDIAFTAVHTGISQKIFHVNTLFQYLQKIIIHCIPDYPADDKKPPEFDFNNTMLDSYLRKRFLIDADGAGIACNPEVIKSLTCFILKNKSKIKNLVIGPEISCSLWTGSSSGKTSFYSVTREQVISMLSEMLLIAGTIESLLIQHGKNEK